MPLNPALLHVNGNCGQHKHDVQQSVLSDKSSVSHTAGRVMHCYVCRMQMAHKRCTDSFYMQSVVVREGRGEGRAHHTVKTEEVCEPQKLQVQLPRSHSS